MYSKKPGGRSLTDQLAGSRPSSPQPGRAGNAPTDRLTGPLRLRQLVHAAPSETAIDITRTVEYRDLVDPRLVWCWGFKVTPEEAHQTCSLMLDAMRAGKLVDWRMEAQEYLRRARVQLGTAPLAVSTPEETSAPVEPPPALDDGGVCEPDGAPKEHEAKTDEPPPPGTVDPPIHVPGGLDTNIDELIRFMRELAHDLDDSFEREAKVAARLLELSDQALSMLISLGIVVGGFAVAAKFTAEGEVVITWAAGASGAEYERRVARAQMAAAELASVLREEQAIEVQLSNAKAGAKGDDPHWNWKTQRERWSKRAIAQIDPEACGAACGEMLLDARGIEHPPQKRMAFMMRGSEEISSVSSGSVARMLGEVDPSRDWRGGFVAGPKEAPAVAAELQRAGPWIAQVKHGDGLHFVFVESLTDENVSILDPWRWADDDKLLERPRGCGKAYDMTRAMFHGIWTGEAIFCAGRKR